MVRFKLLLASRQALADTGGVFLLFSLESNFKFMTVGARVPRN